MKRIHYQQNLKTLPAVDHLISLQLLDQEGNEAAVILNKPRSRGSLVIYNHLAETFGHITPAAAREGLALYAEYADEARQNPGKHPNIDRLFALVKKGETLEVRRDLVCW